MIRIHELKSGVKLLMDPMDSVKSVSVGIWCGTGCINESPELNGISHFIEHMLFKGTETRNAYQIVKEMDSLGAEINAFTTKQRTCFYVKCIDEHLFKACDVLTDMIENPLFDADELEREKLVVIEEINMNTDDPDDVAIENFDEIVLDGSNLARPVLGTKETVMSFNHDILADFYWKHYTKDNMVVSVAGSFDEQALIEYFDEHFGNMGETADILNDAEITGRTESRTIYKDIEQAHLILGTTHVSASDPRRYHMSVLSMIMGGGMSSRLFQNVREKKGLAYSVYSSNSFYTNFGQFGIVAGIAKDRVDEALEAIKEELDKLNNEPITQDEFDTAKAQLKSSLIFSLEAPQSRMRTNGNNYFIFGRCREQEEVIADIDAITLEQLEESKKLISDYNNYTIVNVTGR